MGNPDKTIGVLAAAGDMPVILINQLRAGGYAPYVVAIEAMADAVLPMADVTIRLGAAKRIISAFKDAGCQQIIMTGKFIRPSLMQIKPDLTGAKLAFKALSRSDNDALQLIADFLAGYDIHMADLYTILPDIFAKAGVMIGKAPNKKQQASINKAMAVLDALGNYDVGQAIVIQQQRVLAIEAAEGTNAMIDRAGGNKLPDLLPPILVKMSKRGQNKQLDPPVIGAETITLAAKQGVTMIAIETGAVILADRDDCLATAKRLGVSLIGVKG
ncbi:UDP-2,3-diacylglucosamine diphosphatase LpxI [Alphaproteobacteria bacterium]|nr:UDP-2,3-diacylglucosamine diphosphatase LpxI [Alphaproteobacteria bacterium]